jgi:hypothetical protein
MRDGYVFAGRITDGEYRGGARLHIGGRDPRDVLGPGAVCLDEAREDRSAFPDKGACERCGTMPSGPGRHTANACRQARYRNRKAEREAGVVLEQRPAAS